MKIERYIFWRIFEVKKTFAFILAMVMSFSLFACAGKTEEVQISKMDDLATMLISVQKGTLGDFIAQDLVGEENVMKQVHQMEKYTDAILELKQSKVSATIMDEGPAKKFIEKNDDLMILPDDYEVEAYALAIKKGNQVLLDKVNALIQYYIKDGSIQAIKDKYNSDESIKAESIDFNTGAANGKIIMGTEAGFAPYEFKVGDGIVGVDVEIAAKLAKDLGKELVIEEMAFDALPAALDSGKIDFIAAGMTVTEERQQNMDFSIPYVDDAKQVVVIRKASHKAS